MKISLEIPDEMIESARAALLDFNQHTKKNNLTPADWELESKLSFLAQSQKEEIYYYAADQLQGLISSEIIKNNLNY